MNKSGVVINGLIGPKSIRDFFTPGQFTKKNIQCPMNFGKKTIAIGRIPRQRYTYRVLQTIQMKLILLCVWAEPGRFGQC